MIEVSVRGAKNLAKWLNDVQKNEVKALETAIKVEGYRLRKVLQDEVKAGAPGGRKFAPLSSMARRRGKGVNRTPLQRFASVVRYYVKKNPFQLKVGWTGPQLSGKWKRLAWIHQEGFGRDVTQEDEERLRLFGGQLGRRSKYRNVFFLRKTTTRFRTPARPMIEPFWRAHQGEAWRNIKDNYRRKVRGERI